MAGLVPLAGAAQDELTLDDIAELVAGGRRAQAAQSTGIEVEVGLALARVIRAAGTSEELDRAAKLAPRVVRWLPHNLTGRERASVAQKLGNAFHEAGHPEFAEAVFLELAGFYRPLSVYRSFVSRELARAYTDQGRVADAVAILYEERRLGVSQVMVLIACRCDPPLVGTWLNAYRVVAGLTGGDLERLYSEALKGRAMGLVRQASTLLEAGLPDRAALANVSAGAFLELAHRFADEVYGNTYRSYVEQRAEILLRAGEYGDCARACDTALLSPAIGDNASSRARFRLTRSVAQGMRGQLEPAVAGLLGLCDDSSAPTAVRSSAHLWLAEIGLERPDLTSSSVHLDALLGRELGGVRASLTPLDVARLRAVECALDVDGSGGALPRLEAATHLLIESWDRSPGQGGGRAFLRLANSLAVFGELVAAERRLHGDDAAAESALIWLARVHGVGGLARDLGEGEFDISAFRELLAGADAGVLVVLPGPRRSFALAMDGRGSSVAELPKRHDIAPLIRKLARKLRLDAGSPLASPRLAKAAEIDTLAGALLPGAVADRIASWQNIAVVGAELIESFPVEALTLQGVPLGETHGVCYLPSLPAVARLARRAVRIRAESEFDIAFVSGVRHGAWAAANVPGLAAIELSEAEIRGILGAFAGDYVARRSGPEADLAHLRQLDGSVTRQLLILSHGCRTETTEGRAVVLLDERPGGDSASAPGSPVLSEAVVRELDAPSLVVVAACGAGFEVDLHGDAGSASLTGAWLVAGAACVIEPRGDVRLGSILDLLAGFEQAIAEGASPAEALRQGRLAVAALPNAPATGALMHAVGWAFDPVGVPARRREAPTLALAWIGACLALIAAAFVTRRRRRAATV